MNLTPIEKRHDRYALLYSLLAERTDAISISHRAMPCWGDHVRFIDSGPYEAWYFIGDEPLGACYLSKQNEIGIGIFKEHQGKGYGPQAIKELMRIHGPRRYLANINPRNEPSKGMFASLGFKLCQETYERI